MLVNGSGKLMNVMFLLVIILIASSFVNLRFIAEWLSDCSFIFWFN